MLLCMFVGTALAQVTDLSQLSNDKIYAIKSGRCFLLYSEANADKLSTSTATTITDAERVEDAINKPKQQFKIQKTGENYYLYSVGAGKYLAKDGSFSVDAVDALEIYDVRANFPNYPWKLCIGGNGLNTQIAGQTATGIIINGWTTADAGNTFQIVDIEEKPLLDALNELSTLVNNAKQELSNKYNKYKVTLQTSDANAPFYLSATEQGDAPISAAIDNNPETYYGSTWGSTVGHHHYWQVDLVDAANLEEFTFSYITRANGKDTPTQINVQGSTDGEAFTDIVVLTKSLPTAGGSTYVSAKITNNGYRYIRFEVPSTTTNFSAAGNAEQEVTISIAEFSLFNESSYTLHDNTVNNAIIAAEAVLNASNNTLQTVQNAIAEFNAALVDGQCTVNYSFTYNGVEKYTQTTTTFVGEEWPEFTLPIGVLGTKPEGIVTGDITKVITLSIDNSQLPFVAAKDYSSIDHWYYMNIRDTDPTFAHYSDALNYIPADTAAYDEDNRDAYTWAFVGNPIDGFSIVNLAAGSTMVLSSPAAPTGNTNAGEVARMVTASEATGNKVWTIMPTRHEGAPTGAFYIQHPTKTSYAFNRQNIGGKKALAYWTGRDTGSALQLIERPMGIAPQIEALVVEAEALLATVQANIGSQMGEYSQEAADALSAAIAVAKAVTEETYTEAASEALQAAIDAVKPHLPTPGKYYLIHSSLSKFAEHQAGKVKAVYSDGTNVKWTTANENDKTFYWQAVATSDGGVVFQNAKDRKYMIGNKDKSGQWTVSDTYSEAAKIDIKLFAKGETAEKNEYGVILNGWQMHCAEHSEGKGEGDNVVSWNTDKANSASSWYVVEVELPVFYDVTYNFVYNKEVKFTQTASIKKGGAYPDVVVPFVPYGVTAKATKPEGTVTKNEVVNFELTIEKELPFVTAQSAENITKWYYMRMHTNQPGFIGDIAEDNTINVAWGKTATADKLENFMWGFVGDVFGGITVVNKGTGLQLNSTGDGNATLAETGTSFFIAATTETSANAKYGFCLRKKDSKKYLNANYGAGKLSHWESTDAGSTFFLTEADKATKVKVSNAGYATLFLDYATYIPEEVEAYIVASIDNTSATLAPVTGTLPEKTGVIVKAAEGVYNFTASAEAAASVSGNLLRGSVEDAYIEGEAYVLANAKNGVGLYRAKLNMNAEGAEGTTHFLNNANKAYLPKPAEASARFISFDFGTETAIENIEGAEAENAVVYDLSGRRVQKAQKGVFIVNGKVVIK